MSDVRGLCVHGDVAGWVHHGPHDDAQNPAGINGMRLMDWLGGGGSDASGVGAYRPRDRNSQIVFDEGLATGAVITGRRTGDFAGYWGGDHHHGVPIFVPTHQPPAENPFENVHFVTDGIAACVQQAKAAAGDRDVLMHGAYTAQQALKAGVLDAIEIQLRPVLLGQGRAALRQPSPGAHRARAGPRASSARDHAPALPRAPQRVISMPTARPQNLRVLDGRFILTRMTDVRTIAFQTDLLALVLGPDGGATMRRDDTAEDAWAALWNGDDAHDPDATGMLSAIIAPLAANELPVWTAASYDGDLVLVPAGRLKEAVDLLRQPATR